MISSDHIASGAGGDINVLRDSIAGLTIEIEDLIDKFSRFDRLYTSMVGVHEIQCEESEQEIRELRYKIKRMKEKGSAPSVRALNEELALAFADEREQLDVLLEEARDCSEPEENNVSQSLTEKERIRLQTLYKTLIKTWHPIFFTDKNEKLDAQKKMLRITELYANGQIAELEHTAENLRPERSSERKAAGCDVAALKRFEASLFEELSDLKSGKACEWIRRIEEGETPEILMKAQADEAKTRLDTLKEEIKKLDRAFRKLIEKAKSDDDSASPDAGRTLGQARKLFKEGQEHQKRGSLDRAIIAYEKAIEAAPLVLICGPLGECWFDRGEYRKSVQYLRKALFSFPDKTYYAGLLGLSYYFLGDYTRAAETLGPVVERRPDETRFVRALGLSLYRQGSYDPAIPFLECVHERNPDDIHVVEGLGECYYRESEYQKALALLEKTAEKATGTPLMWYFLGMVNRQLMKPSRAVKWLKKAVEARPGNQPLVRTLAQCYREMGMNEEAKMVLAGSRGAETGAQRE